jgi:organic radical activating enzyme
MGRTGGGAGMSALTLAEIEEARWGTGDSVLLFLTDRCPVGCAHCSVDSRPDSARITDFALLERIVGGLARSDFSVVGISGGEPFVERRGLRAAVDTLAAAGKDVVIYTSGFWARRADAPSWIAEVLARSAAVVVSTDSFHQHAVAAERFRNAVTAAARAGTPVVVQVLDLPGEAEEVRPIVEAVRSEVGGCSIEVNLIQPLPYGRAKGLVAEPAPRAATSFGPCRVARAPVVRYDGRVSLCCNENVLMGAGPAYLRRRLDPAQDVGRQLRAMQGEALLTIVGRVGVGVLAQHPRAGDLRDRTTRGMCGACWGALRRLGDAPADPLLTAMAGLAAREQA